MICAVTRVPKMAGGGVMRLPSRHHFLADGRSGGRPFRGVFCAATGPCLPSGHQKVTSLTCVHACAGVHACIRARRKKKE